tara:strand:- start:18 stop:1658 length:1641 start_codon:yes stop_codon:yes gene_type:complete
VEYHFIQNNKIKNNLFKWITFLYNINMDEWINYYLESHPEIATMNGFKGYESRYSQFTPQEDYNMAIQCLNKFNGRTMLSLDEKYTMVILQNIIKEYNLGFHYMPFNHQENPINEYIEYSSEGFVPLGNDYQWKSHTARIDYFVTYITNIIFWSTKGINLNYLPVKSDLEKMVKSIRGILKNKEYINKKRGLVSNFQYNQYLEALKNKLVPCINDFLNYLINLLETGFYRNTIGLSDINQNGHEMYKHLINRESGLNYSIEEIYNIGLQEIGRIQLEMMEIKDSMGYSDMDLYTFQKEIIRKPISQNKIIPLFKKLRKENKEIIARNFYMDVSKDCEIIKCPPHSEGQSIAYYWDPSIEPLREGGFYINTSNSANNSSHTFLALSLHEDSPGHHFHFQFLKDIDAPLIYRLFPNNGYVEGWGLYCESLGNYKDNHSLFGRLSFDMLRSCRLVIDIGIHCYNFKKQDAIQFVKDFCLLEDDEVEIEIDRYIAIPGQALAYKLGEMKIVELRDRCKKMGKSRRRFHEELLTIGPITLSMVENILCRHK